MALAVTTVALGERARLGTWPATLLAPGAVSGVYFLSYNMKRDFAHHHPLARVLWGITLFGTVHIGQRAKWQDWLAARTLTGLGLISCSLFIWHEPITLGLYHAGILPTGRAGFPMAAVIVLGHGDPRCDPQLLDHRVPHEHARRLKDSKGRPRQFYPQQAST